MIFKQSDLKKKKHQNTTSDNQSIGFNHFLGTIISQPLQIHVNICIIYSTCIFDTFSIRYLGLGAYYNTGSTIIAILNLSCQYSVGRMKQSVVINYQ